MGINSIIGNENNNENSDYFTRRIFQLRRRWEFVRSMRSQNRSIEEEKKIKQTPSKLIRIEEINGIQVKIYEKMKSAARKRARYNARKRAERENNQMENERKENKKIRGENEIDEELTLNNESNKKIELNSN